MEFIYLLDILGTFAFAISGALVASEQKFDLFGVAIIAFVTAVGGGMLRDILINAHPINWIGDLNYIYIKRAKKKKKKKKNQKRKKKKNKKKKKKKQEAGF
jgi:uncharacterized membrane protein YeiH